uniref:Solute carrier family 45 member 3-like n=1 Tax=Saccoglossus kowalevskii TaxID=10224 RepID=A0ABM0GTU1_SACKO|nr:PREDICTED: solute carrier family 45 member 3-like [Saccoglossus kowalevskii]
MSSSPTDSVSISTSPSPSLGKQFSFSYLLSLNAITCGLELCTSAAFSYVPPMLLKAGFSEFAMSFVMGLGPVFALFVVPFLGVLSDRCTSQYGRRRPFIFYLSLGTILTLVLIANGHNIGMINLAIAVIILDFCTQACYTPFEALLSDSCKNSHQHNRSFMVFSFMTSVGGCFGYWLTSIDWERTAFRQYFDRQEHAVFAILLITFTTSAVLSLSLARDTPVSRKPSLSSLKTNGMLQMDSPAEKQKDSVMNGDAVFSVLISDGSELQGRNPIHNLVKTRTKVTQYKFCIEILHRFIPGFLCDNVFSLYSSIVTMPSVLTKLWIAHFTTCTAVMGFKIFFTDFVGAAIYGGHPDVAEGTHLQYIYDSGVRMGSWGLLLHGLTSSIYAVCLESLVNVIGTKRTYIFGMVTFTIATSMMVFTKNVGTILWLSAITGCSYATITALPYTVLSSYHGNIQKYYPDLSTEDTSLHGKGVDVALLDSAYFLSETAAAFLFGSVVQLTGSTVMYILCSAIFGFISCFYLFRIQY